MKKSFLLLFPLLLTLSLRSQAQDIAGAVPGPQGIYLYLGKDIPRQFSYQVTRKEAGKKRWQEVAACRFEKDSNTFFDQLEQLRALHPTYQLPKPQFYENIWRMIEKATNVDSVYFYGQNPVFQLALGTVFYDTTARAGLKYEYKVTAVGQPDFREKRSAVLAYPMGQVDYRLDAQKAEAFERKVVLQYNALGNVPAAVRVFRQVYMQTGFEEIYGRVLSSHQGDTTRLFVEDTLVTRQMTYRYVAVPYDAYGNAGKSSDTLRITNLIGSSTPDVLRFTSQRAGEKDGIRLNWTLKNQDYVQGIQVYRSDAYDSQSFRLLGSVTAEDTTFLDVNVVPAKSYFYYLVLSGAYGGSIRSARISGYLDVSHRLPLPPTAFKIEQRGDSAVLSWRRLDPTTHGYYVYRRTGEDSLQLVSPLLAAKSDSMGFVDRHPQTRTGTWQYAIRTVNATGEMSAFSNVQTITWLKTRTIQAPMAFRHRLMKGKVLLFWSPQELSESGVTGYRVLRAEEKNKDAFRTLHTATLTHQTNSFEDVTAEPGVPYQYVLEALSADTAQHARTQVLRIVIPVQLPLSPIGMRLSAENKGVRLSWDQTDQEGVKGYKVYREKPEGGWEHLATLAKSTNTFVDHYAGNGSVLTYSITSYTETNHESQKDDKISIEVEE